MATQYLIKSGDTLSKIASQQGTTIAELQRLNPSITDPNKIYAGQFLNLPATTPTGYNPISGTPLSPTQLSTLDLTTQTNQNMSTEGSPAIKTNVGDTQAQIAGIQSGLTSITEELKKLQTQTTTPVLPQSTETKSALTKLTEAITGRQKAQETQKTTEQIATEAETTALAKWGLTPESYQEITTLTGQLTSYNQQLADLGVRKQVAIDAIGEKPIDARYITQEQAVQEKRYNSEIAAVSAQAGVVVQTIQLKQGQIDKAQATAKDIISYITHDQEQKIADLDWAKDTYSDLYAILSKEDQTAWDNAYQVEKDKLTADTKRLTDISNMVIDAAKQGIDLGITDWSKISVEEATKLYQEKVSTTVKTGGGFTDPEIRKLQQAGLANASYQEKLDYLYGSKTLSQTFLNRVAAAGVPNDVATYIQTSLNNGATLDEIRQDLTNQLGDKEKAYRYLDTYIPMMQKASTDDLISILQGLMK